ncbi:MAG TPA: NADAR family protein [Candidatus Paceibacterota bacterium]|nr:NADAR family protein [Candidatus Paceibacterota bacterium]
MTQTQDGPVLFYMQPYYCLDNFSAFRVTVAGHTFDTAEHAYQWYKFDDPHIQDLIRTATSAHEAKLLAKEYSGHKRASWHEIKTLVMENVLRAKLAQHEYVRRKLLQTGDRLIVEDSPVDSFWGRGPDGNGQNVLGNLWMKLRAELRGGGVARGIRGE